LDPPGIGAVHSEGMRRASNEYFNWYLDGIRDKPPPATDAKVGAKKSDTKRMPTDWQIFEQRDRNEDDEVTWDEYLGGRTEKVDLIRRAFNRRDKNSDGVWQKSELPKP